jgi:hypothetical protein
VVINLLCSDNLPGVGSAVYLDEPTFAAAHLEGTDTRGGRRRKPLVVEPDWLADPILVLPGLVHALATATIRGISTDLTAFDLNYHDMCFACALELVMATPGDQTQLPRPSPALSARIAEAATRAQPSSARDPSASQLNPPPREHDR